MKRILLKMFFKYKGGLKAQKRFLMIAPEIWKWKGKRSIQWDIKPYTNERGRRQWLGLGPLGPGGPATAAVPFHLSMVWCLIVLIVFTSFSICIHFILCFQCVFDLYLLLYFPYFYFLCFFLYFLFFMFYIFSPGTPSGTRDHSC